MIHYCHVSIWRGFNTVLPIIKCRINFNYIMAFVSLVTVDVIYVSLYIMYNWSHAPWLIFLGENKPWCHGNWSRFHLALFLGVNAVSELNPHIRGNTQSNFGPVMCVLCVFLSFPSLFLPRCADVCVQQGNLWVFSCPNALSCYLEWRGGKLLAYTAGGHG